MYSSVLYNFMSAELDTIIRRKGKSTCIHADNRTSLGIKYISDG